MTELAVRDEHGADVARQSDVPATVLGRWAHDARQAASVAQSLARTPFVPMSLRERATSREPEEIQRAHEVTVGNITAAILTGNEMGLQPMAALRSIDVIQGTPATRAATIRAVVLAHGHDMWLVESTETRCLMKGQRAGSSHVQEIVWTFDRARKLQLVGKPNWKNQPQTMLVARATSELGRLIAPDALLGIAYSIEELDDGDTFIEQPDTSVAEAEPKPRRTAQRRTRGQQQGVARPPVPVEEPPAAAPEPEFDDDPITVQSSAPAEPDVDDQADEVPMISDKQLKKLGTVYTSLGITDRDARLTDVTEFLGRDIESSKELTRDEATRLIDDLERRSSGTTREPSTAAERDDSESDPCTVCGADAAKDEPHDDDVHAEAGQ